MEHSNLRIGLLIVTLVLGMIHMVPAHANHFGIYPDCVPPAIGIESQAWWDEKSSPLPGFDNDPDASPEERLMSKFRHIHMGVCVPNVRDNDSTALNLSGIQEFVAVVIMHNNPGQLNRVGMKLWKGDESRVFVRYHPSTVWTEQSGTCTGGEMSCVFFDPALTCPERQTCRFEVPIKIHLAPSAAGCSGVCELRLRPNVTGIEPRGDREFTTNNAQIYVGGTGHYRSQPSPIGRGWYTGLEYANARIVNYMDLFQGRTDLSIPVVDGKIDLRVSHAQGTGENIRSIMRINPNAHKDLPGILVYDEPGNYSGTVTIDTTQLPNGRNALFLSTQEDNEFGTNIGILKLFIDVQNGVRPMPPSQLGVY